MWRSSKAASLPARSTPCHTASYNPCCINHITKRAAGYDSGNPMLRNTIPSSASPMLSPALALNVPAADHSPPSRRLRVGSSLKLGSNIIGQMHQPTRCGAVRKPRVAPQVFKHTHKMRFATPKKAADPHRRLFGLPEVPQKGVEDAFKAALVLALADKGLEIEAQRFSLLRRSRFHNFGNTIVGNVALQGIGEKNVLVECHAVVPSCALIGVAK